MYSIQFSTSDCAICTRFTMILVIVEDKADIPEQADALLPANLEHLLDPWIATTGNNLSAVVFMMHRS